MENIINQLMNHRSIRKFKDEQIDDSVIEKLVRASQMASTSSYVQAYSIIGIDDVELKGKLSEVSTQKHVQHNGHMFVFVMDYNRHYQLSKELGVESLDFGTTESLLVGTIDAALAAENMAIAAESLGLGICFIGSLRNDSKRVSEILKLPDYTFPLFGMVIGVPDEEGSQKERLPFKTVYHRNQYEPFDYEKQYEAYDQNVSDYYASRTEGKRKDKWSEQVIHMLTGKTREDVDSVLKSKGFLKQ